MPVTTVTPIVPCSQQWTNAEVASTVRALISELDNERIENAVIRRFINVAVSQVAELLMVASDPAYGVAWDATLEAGTIGGLSYINLSSAVNQNAPGANTGQRRYTTPVDVTANYFIPSNVLSKVFRVTGTATVAQAAVPSVWVGNLAARDLAELTTLLANENTSYRQSMCWAHHGHNIYIYRGSEIDSVGTTNPLVSPKQYNAPLSYTIWGYRTPMLDNLLGEKATGSTWNSLIDVPDKHMRLVILLAQKQCLESMSKQLDQPAAAELLNLTQTIKDGAVQEIQFEKAKRERQNIGVTSR